MTPSGGTALYRSRDHGLAHIAYADDNRVNMLRVANQTSGPGNRSLSY